MKPSRILAKLLRATAAGLGAAADVLHPRPSPAEFLAEVSRSVTREIHRLTMAGGTAPHTAPRRTPDSQPHLSPHRPGSAQLLTIAEARTLVDQRTWRSRLRSIPGHLLHILEKRRGRSAPPHTSHQPDRYGPPAAAPSETGKASAGHPRKTSAGPGISH